jgi:integrase
MVEHRKPLARDQIPAFLKALDCCGGHRTTLRLILLAFVRTAELRGAAWAEVDLLRTEWRIPGSRMKMREGHLVPWSDQALALLEVLHTHMRGRQWLFRLFPNYFIPKTRMSATTLNRALERMGFSRKHGIGLSAHGSRATASTIPNEQPLAQILSSVSSPMPNETKHGQATTRLNILTTGDSCCSIVPISWTTFRVPRTTLHIRSFCGTTRSDIPTP